MLDTLNHFHDLDARFAHRLPPAEQTPEAIERILRRKGAPDLCHVTGNGDLDGRDLPLHEAVERV